MAIKTAFFIFLTVARAIIRASNTFFATFFRFKNIKSSQSNNNNYNANNNIIFHKDNSVIYFTLSAFSAFNFWLDLIERNTITAIKASTATRPPIKPAPNVPVVANVPI